MAKYIVRKGFNVLLRVQGNDQTYPEGSELELTSDQYDRVCHQVEPLTKQTKVNLEG